MKLLKLILLALVLAVTSVTNAQVSVNVNIGTPPVWGPVGHADCRYYYLPDIQTYYDVNTAMFIYAGPRGWIHARVLPEIYAGFDLYNGCKVVLSFRGDNPYRYYNTHCVRYPKGYKHGRRHDNGNHYGHYKNGKSKHREVIYVNDDHHDNFHDNGGKHGGHGRGNGNRRG